MNKKIFNHTGHKELWNWLANNPTMEKTDWEDWSYNGGKYEE